jgi:hypothetical protein
MSKSGIEMRIVGLKLEEGDRIERVGYDTDSGIRIEVQYQWVLPAHRGIHSPRKKCNWKYLFHPPPPSTVLGATTTMTTTQRHGMMTTMDNYGKWYVLFIYKSLILFN